MLRADEIYLVQDVAQFYSDTAVLSSVAWLHRALFTEYAFSAKREIERCIKQRETCIY